MSKAQIFPDKPSFLRWVSETENGIATLLDLVDPGTAADLDFELNSLDTLEAWLLRSFSDYRDLLLEENFGAYDGAARYFGEVLRRAVEGEWVACLEDLRSSNFGYPSIDNYSNRGARIMPHFCITAAIDRKLGNYLSSIASREIQRASGQLR